MKVNLLILTAFIALTAGITGFIKHQEADNVFGVFEKAPEFEYTRLGGVKGTLTEYKGKVVLIHFWATWCPPCIVEFPELIALTDGQKDNLIVLAVSVDEKKQDVERFLKKQKSPLPENFIIIQDAERKIAGDLFNIEKFPANILLSSTLEIREVLKGPEDNWNSNKWRDKIETLAK